jgi:hypothetical protein
MNYDIFLSAGEGCEPQNTCKINRFLLLTLKRVGREGFEPMITSQVYVRQENGTRVL